MKKIFLIFTVIFLLPQAFCFGETNSAVETPAETIMDDPIELILPENNTKEIPVVVETPAVSPYSKEALKGLIEKDYDLNSPDGLFKEQLKARFHRGLIKETGAQLSIGTNFSENISENSNFKYNVSLINVGLKGKFKSEQEGFNFLFDLTPNIKENFFHRLVLDAWVETNRFKNHKIMLGTSRPNVGFEGGQSPYTLPFVFRSQTARNFGNIRKTGLRIKGNYKYADYDIGGYSSDTWYSEFFPGVETDLWLTLKPFENINKEKFGNLNLMGGYQAGSRNSTDFSVVSTALKYDYKKFEAMAEYQTADGSNGSTGLTNKKRWGYNVTLKYHLTKKLELLARYDDFDPDKKKANNNTKEYTFGLNYYILGQTVRLCLNYIFLDNQNKKDGHKIIFATQFLL